MALQPFLAKIFCIIKLLPIGQTLLEIGLQGKEIRHLLMRERPIELTFSPLSLEALLLKELPLVFTNDQASLILIPQ